MGLPVVIFCCLLVLQFPAFTALTNNTVDSGYEHGNAENVRNPSQSQRISNIKELLKDDLAPITNYSQPLGPVYVLRGGGGGHGGGGGGHGGGGGGRGGGGRGGGSRGGTRGSRGGYVGGYGGGYGGSSGGACNKKKDHKCKSIAAPLNRKQNQFGSFTTAGVAIFFTLMF